MSSTPRDVEIVEVGPRDGLQNATGIMATEAKKAWIEQAAKAGFPEIEVCSFVPPKLVPAMHDSPELTDYAVAIEGLTVSVLAPNLRGAQNAAAHHPDKIVMPISVSRSHCLSNIRKTPEEAVEDLRAIAEFRAGLPKDEQFILEVGLSTAFGCTMEGHVPDDDILRLGAMCLEAGADEVAPSDTVGYANPGQVTRVYKRCFAEFGADKVGGGHFHNTRGLGIANCLAAYEVGIRAFDTSLAGLGGCPFAPGAKGNVATEDLVFMFEAMGVRTGIDIDAMLACREIVRAALPEDPLYGHLSESGIPKGFSDAVAAAAE